MTVAVALAMLERQGKWLLQLRDDIEGIVYPGHWGLFGGHLEANETPEQALRRELKEEINGEIQELPLWFSHHDSQRSAYFFRAALPVPIEALELLEGQDMVLASLNEMASGAICTPRLDQPRPLAPSLRRAMLELELEQSGLASAGNVRPWAAASGEDCSVS